MIRSEAFQREGNGRVVIKEWFAAGKSDLEAPEVHMPFLQLCKSLHSSISLKTKVEKSWALEKSWETFAEGKR